MKILGVKKNEWFYYRDGHFQANPLKMKESERAIKIQGSPFTTDFQGKFYSIRKKEEFYKEINLISHAIGLKLNKKKDV